MSNITDWIREELYPSLFDLIDQALPELNFKRVSGDWRSPLKMDSSQPEKKRPDKTVVTRKLPTHIHEQGGGTISLVDYVMDRDRVEFIQAVKTLANVAGLQLPKGDLNQEEYRRYRDRSSLLEACNSYFIYCLNNSPRAEGVRAYLHTRGYSEKDIEAMELGYIPSREQLKDRLLDLGYSEDLIKEVIAFDSRVDSSHQLTIPYRSGGALKGFKFRTVGDYSPKYINSTGLDIIGGFFNLLGIKGDKDLVIVEGELDSLSATARGVDNVVALGGSSISPEQVRDAIKRGARSFTVCLDLEPGKEEETYKKVNRVIRVILAEGVNRVYTVTLPAIDDKKVDSDRLIKERGIEAFKGAIKTATAYYEYWLQEIMKRRTESLKEPITDRGIDSLLEEVTETASSIPDPGHRDLFKKRFISQPAIMDLGITEESLSITVDRLTSTREKEAQEKGFRELIRKAQELQSRGAIDQALGLLEEKTGELRIAGGRDLLPPFMDFNSLLGEIATMPPAYRTGYEALDQYIGFTPGAITLVAGRPSHGKTTFMFNLLLEMSRLYPEKTFYFFTYEEPARNITVKLLNRLTNRDLREHYRDMRGHASKEGNYEYLKYYIRSRREDIPAIEKGKKALRELIDSHRIKIIDRSYSVEQLAGLIAYLNKTEDIGAIFIDYIQRMNTERKTQDKRTEVAHISNKVLQIAKNNGLPIILGAQLNRETTDKPRLENLKEAGNLEEDANTVISLYCNAREQEDNGIRVGREVDLEIAVLKNREGEVNRKQVLKWDRLTQTIKDTGRDMPKNLLR